MHGYDYLQFSGQNAFFADAELRFPIIEAALTPIGVIGGIRGVFFANIGGGSFTGAPGTTYCSSQGLPSDIPSPYSFAANSSEICKSPIGVQTDLAGNPILTPAGTPVLLFSVPRSVDGFRLKDGRASYGVGLETFALGFPIHFDWSWRTLFNRDWEDVVFAGLGGSHEFRKARFSVWIGYDF
jgi:outer membrane protein assembly factor BamA